MDIPRVNVSLDNISQPPSSERTGSRVSSVSLSEVGVIYPTTPITMAVLNNDASNNQEKDSSEENINNSPSPEKGSSHAYVLKENEDPELQKALEEMQRLDIILAANILKEKEVKCKGKELKEILWQELQQNKPKRSSECAFEAENTRCFLALTASNAQEPKEEVDFVPVFGTQVPDQEYDERNYGDKEQSEKELDSATGLSAEVGLVETGQKQLEGSRCGAAKAKEKQEDFVKKNIELASGAGGPVPLTQAEKERLAELLRNVEEEEEDDASAADSEGDMGAVSVPAVGQGYTPEPAKLDQLTAIDSRLHLLLPLEDFLSVRSSYPNLSVSQVHGSEASWEFGGDARPGEKVLQDIRERRGQDRRLQEIQQQLEILGQGQEMNLESPGLPEEQLLTLLEECELTRSWSRDLETRDTTPTDPYRDADSPLSCTPSLSEGLLSELLEDVYTTSFPRLENGTC